MAAVLVLSYTKIDHHNGQDKRDWCLYFIFFAILHTATGESHISTPATLLCGITAGLAASVTTQPFDVVKTRMQLKPSDYQSFRTTLVELLSDGKIRELFSGLAPRATRRTLMAAFTWAFYEEVRKQALVCMVMLYSMLFYLSLRFLNLLIISSMMEHSEEELIIKFKKSGVLFFWSSDQFCSHSLIHWLPFWQLHLSGGSSTEADHMNTPPQDHVALVILSEHEFLIVKN